MIGAVVTYANDVFLAIIALNKTYDVYLTSSPPTQMMIQLELVIYQSYIE